MKKGATILIILVVFLVLIVATVASFFFFEFGRPPSVSSRSYLEIHLKGAVQEKAAPNFFSALLMQKPALGMHDIWMNLRKARSDDRVKALVLRLGYLECDWGKINEIREAVLDFRMGGKKAYAYIEESMDSDKEYYLATACDQICLNPMGSLIVNGIGGDVLFLKKTLDKIGVEAEIEHLEEYKTAYHMFTKEGFTPAQKNMMESIYGDIFDQYIHTTAAARKKSEEDMRALIDRGYFSAAAALETGLVDALLYEDEFTDLVRGDQGKIVRLPHAAYSQIKPSSLGLDKGRKIALIYGMGPIHSGEGTFQSMGSTTVARWFRQVRTDKSIEAVVFRIDSPGGSVVASDVIWREVWLTRKEKPVIVTMSDMAGSGGYWVAMHANRIFAHPQTLTGSIGIIFGKFNMMRLYEKIGVTSESLLFGRNADMFSSFARFRPEVRDMVREEMRKTYDHFIAQVADGRGMSKEDVEKIAKGRVWTGRQAQKLGLVDEMGGLSEAIAAAKEEAGIPDTESVRLVVLPRDYSFFDVLFSAFSSRLSRIQDARFQKLLTIFKALKDEPRWALMPLLFGPQ